MLPKERLTLGWAWRWNNQDKRYECLVFGWTWKWNNQDKAYECRGLLEYDNNHVEVPDSRVWKSALEFVRILSLDGIKGYPLHLKDGWCQIRFS